jgi:hypothetical protein
MTEKKNKTRKKQKQTGWAIFEPKGVMRAKTFDFTRKGAINKILKETISFTMQDWSSWKQFGWTCRKVSITEI